MNHHVIAHINTTVNGGVGVRGVIGIDEKHQIAGTGVGRGNRGADVAKALCSKPPHVPAGVVDDPADKARTVKGSAGTAAAPDVGHPQIFLRLREHSGEYFVLQGFRRYIVVQIVLPLGCVGVLLYGKQVWPVALVRHGECRPGDGTGRNSPV